MTRHGNDKGFTLTELLIVVAIIAILGAIAIPAYVGYIRNAKTAEAKANLQSLSLLLGQYYAENQQYCPAVDTNYEYKEDDSGAVVTSTLTTYLPGFKPKGAGASDAAVLYDYKVRCSTVTAFLVTATPVSGRGTPSGNLTLNQDGTKGGW
jgi:prepilin-type N-terminal cleavage/methylation domain-containing protein